ncbi:hypothetical protein ACGC1H_000150 [Rhizoctonia solani]
MFDPRVSMELSQHLFDIQMAKYTQRARQSQVNLISIGTPSSGSSETIERTSENAQEELVTNNSGVGADNAAEPGQPVQTMSNLAIRERIETSNRLAEQANQLAERSNLLIERSNKLAERTIQYFEQTNRIVESSTKPVETLGEVLKNINKVLVGIQHAIVRSHKGNTVKAADCLVNEKGETPGQSTEMAYASFEWLSWRFGDQPSCQFPVVIAGTQHDLHIDDHWLGRFLRFYGACQAFCEDGTSTGLKAACEKDARLLFGRYLSTCLG